jgi:hypothetical protein
MDREKGCGSWIEKESMDESMQGSVTNVCRSSIY